MTASDRPTKPTSELEALAAALRAALDEADAADRQLLHIKQALADAVSQFNEAVEAVEAAESLLLTAARKAQDTPT